MYNLPAVGPIASSRETITVARAYLSGLSTCVAYLRRGLVNYHLYFYIYIYIFYILENLITVNAYYVHLNHDSRWRN